MMIEAESDSNIDLDCEKLTCKDSAENVNEWENTIDTQKASRLKLK